MALRVTACQRPRQAGPGEASVCSDPWPLHAESCGGIGHPPDPHCQNQPTCDTIGHEAMEALLNNLSEAFGYEDWVTAYHEFKVPE